MASPRSAQSVQDRYSPVRGHRRDHEKPPHSSEPVVEPLTRGP
jgi:hypothetical protein